jgi:hypothetical protein
MKLFLIITLMISTTVSVAQDRKYIAYEAQTAKFDSLKMEWVWSDFDSTNAAVIVGNKQISVNGNIFHYFRDDEDGKKYDNCKTSWLAISPTGSGVFLYLHKYPSGIEGLSVIYGGNIVRYLIKEVDNTRLMM